MQLICGKGCMYKKGKSELEWAVGKNEKCFSRGLNTQVCELLQVLTKLPLKVALKNKCSWNFETQ